MGLATRQAESLSNRILLVLMLLVLLVLFASCVGRSACDDVLLVNTRRSAQSRALQEIC
jgi:hypothetical protein